MTAHRLLPVLALVAACEPLAPDDVLAADPQMLDVDGARGPHAVATFEVVGPNSARVFFPSDSDVARPLALVVQGGLVETDRYAWLAVHLASKGHVTVVPEHALDLAFFQQWKWARVLDDARALADDAESPIAGLVDDAPGIALGHSLGGVVAAKAWLVDEERLHTLALLGSAPDAADDNGARTTGRVVSITGSADTRVSPDEAALGAAAYRAPLTRAVVVGMTHMHWADFPTEGEEALDGEPGTSAPEARRRALKIVDDALRELRGETPHLLDDPERFPRGVTSP